MNTTNKQPIDSSSSDAFSVRLRKAMLGSNAKTVGSILDIFDEKSFAIIFMILMIIPATPIPTGGLTHIFELIVIILATQLVVSREDLWLPGWLYNKKLPPNIIKKAMPFLIDKVMLVEKISKPRYRNIIDRKLFRSQLGVFVIVFAAAAFIAPPFTGLDTLPSIAVVLISLGVILEDLFVIILGYLTGILGITILFLLSAGVITFIERLF